MIVEEKVHEIRRGDNVNHVESPEHFGTVVALENTDGELTIRHPDGFDWVADRHTLVKRPRVDVPQGGAKREFSVVVGDTAQGSPGPKSVLIDTTVTAEKPDLNPEGVTTHDPDLDERDSAIFLSTETKLPVEPEAEFLGDSINTGQAHQDARLVEALATAAQKAQKAKKTAVLIREMEKAGFMPRRGASPTPKRTSPADWVRVSSPASVSAQEADAVDLKGSVAQKYIDEQAKIAKKRKKNLAKHLRAQGLTYRGPEPVTYGEAKKAQNWRK